MNKLKVLILTITCAFFLLDVGKTVKCHRQEMVAKAEKLFLKKL